MRLKRIPEIVIGLAIVTVIYAYLIIMFPVKFIEEVRSAKD